MTDLTVPLRPADPLPETISPIELASEVQAPGLPVPQPASLGTELPSGLPRIADFVLEAELGRGGMGVVYQARQMPLNRVVALKMILAGDHAHPNAKARFLAEAEAIAKVRHPGIVQVYAYGTHQGHPYFALEYVEGGSLDRALAHRPIPGDAAANLVAQMADAVQAAHQTGIIHRDLKPANVLLSLSRESKTSAPDSLALDVVSRLNNAIPKIADFGLAKQLDSGPGPTASGATIGTPSYMAPEQARGKLASIGPATDVYALGAILYECLTGRAPFLGHDPLDTMLQVINEELVPPSRLQPKLHPDLETICCKCLNKEQAKRYSSAQALADDLRNYLAGRPILARPAGPLERGWKWCRRYPAVAALLLVSTLAALVATLLAWWALSAEQTASAAAAAEREARQIAQRERDAKEQARQHEERQRKYAEAIAAFVKHDFLALFSVEGQDRFGGEGKDQLHIRMTLGDLLDRAGARLEQRTDLDPKIEADLRWTIGMSYRGGGDPRRAIPFLERSAQQYQDRLGPDAPRTLQVKCDLGVAYSEAGKHREALALLAKVHADQVRTLGADHPHLPPTTIALAGAYADAGRMREALAQYEHARHALVRDRGPQDPAALVAGTYVASALLELGRVREALGLFEQIRADQSRQLSPDHPNLLATLSGLASASLALGKRTEAIALLEQVSAVREQKLGAEHPQMLTSLHFLGTVYSMEDRTAEALPLLERVYEARVRRLGSDHPNTLVTRNGLAACYWREKRLDKSVPLLEESLRQAESQLGRQHLTTQRTIANLAVNYLDAGRLSEALPLLEEVYAASRKHPQLRWVGSRLLEAYAQAGSAGQAATMAAELASQAREALPKESPQLAGELGGLGMKLLQAKAYAEAEPLLRECLAIRAKTQPDAWTTFNSRSMLGEALRGQRKFSEAEPLLLQGYQGLTRHADAMPPSVRTVRLREAAARLMDLYVDWNKPDLVKKWEAARAGHVDRPGSATGKKP